MNKVIVITGASSGFGALTARALAVAGHRVYAGPALALCNVCDDAEQQVSSSWHSDHETPAKGAERLQIHVASLARLRGSIEPDNVSIR